MFATGQEALDSIMTTRKVQPPEADTPNCSTLQPQVPCLLGHRVFGCSNLDLAHVCDRVTR